MGRMYTVAHSGTLTNAGGDSDLFELTPADDKPIRLRRIRLSQISELGDAAEEGLRISIFRFPATVTSGSGGSTPTPVPCDDAGSAAGFTAEVNNTTVATTSGSAALLESFGWNIRNTPFELYWEPEEAPIARQGSALIVRLESTPTDDITAQITAWVEEI